MSEETKNKPIAVGTAHKRTGIAKATITKAIVNGVLSARVEIYGQGKSRYMIDPVELDRFAEKFKEKTIVSRYAGKRQPEMSKGNRIIADARRHLELKQEAEQYGISVDEILN